MSTAVHRLTTIQLAASLQNMRAIMDKSAAHAAAHGFGTATLLQSRLYPNMFNLLQQLQYVCFLAVDLGQHFSAAPPPRVGYDEESWEQLAQSLETSATYLGTISDADIARHMDRQVSTFFDSGVQMNVIDYAAAVSLPDFYFHMSIAYAILRHNGVPLGKSDFLGRRG